ncbi:MAG: alpha-amylase/alpha-mannosidase (GH57 family) [Polaribacter sp.]|jgi:alpha-amylase/alpha-mannosidase (GH57 family)
MSTNKYLCIHGHFYQPPRENAWLEAVELQDSAQPFHDWNERINFECYAPNRAARILNANQEIIKIQNNYSHISFNFGPTLLYWMKEKDPITYNQIVAADKRAQEKYSGHGSAIAQAHGHLILPLCNDRDKETQVKWGIQDFEMRFGRKPEGMWLAETAADVASLEVLAANNIKFTILAPRQAKAVKKIKGNKWSDVSGDRVDPRRPYRCYLPSGNSIDLFFYDGNVAQDVAFKGLLNNGKAFADRLMSTADDNDEPQIIHIATDGESYGHHHRNGEMALADCLNHVETNNMATLTTYGEYLEKFPPTWEAQIFDNSSWSCVHGVERWKSNCGCNSGREGWHQEWRGPLRGAFDWLRGKLIKVFEKEGAKLLKDPWAARNEYIQVINDRDRPVIDAFVKKHAIKKLSKSELTSTLRLLEMQRNAMLMYTSCGWFFDEISGLETNQILQYALRAIEYCEQLTGKDYENDFMRLLKNAPSNVFKDGSESFKSNVLPNRVGLTRAGMHFAVAALFEESPEEMTLFNYIAESDYIKKDSVGSHKLIVGKAVMKSKITLSEKKFQFAVLYLGQQSLIGYIRTDLTDKAFGEMEEDLFRTFHSNNLGEVIAAMPQHFGTESYSFDHLFRDERRKILKQITKRNMRNAESSFREIYDDNYQLMSSMEKGQIPIPKAYQNVVQFIVNADMHRFFTKDNLDIDNLKRLSKEIKKWKITLSNEDSFTLAASERIYYEIQKIEHSEDPVEQVNKLTELLHILKEMNVDLNIWKSQNLFFPMIKGYLKGTWVFASPELKEAHINLSKLLEINSERKGMKV